MRWLRLSFLILAAVLSSGYKFRCWIFCTDQTAIQNDYIEQRDRCRNFAQLKLDMRLKSMKGPIDDSMRKTQLVNLFSECMGNNNWIVPSGAGDKPSPGAAPPAASGSPSATVPVVPIQTLPPPPETDPYYDRAVLSRSAECAFARHAAKNSSIQAARARACDLECAQRLKAAPEAPRPASCPSESGPDLSKGVDREGGS